ncbi:hypothetical protein BN140_1025 [Methanoculleus bourgensis MS2]|jgi:hypothetical protein|uniref:Uncharacterized protein n=1 Tax=Methanoculleus bourgensis (strain ATCC 43281 / DSM 3045 / OCM 15 / MS2) TaxID=1201294 RepID=I7J883_METBM|nr:hypothetical protein [Methanoculleus bourgensis]CCJ35948.1 hypothetical protein BN140_1025 [Methanoculleus bourgensis MS2]
MPAKNESFLLYLLAAALILPVNIYLIGEEGLGAGLQTSFLRYQQTHLGTSVITLADDLGYVTSGIIGGRSALSVLIWALGTALLLAASGYLIYSRYNGGTTTRRPLVLLTAGGAVAYLASCIAQYGTTLHGPAGLSIPVGVPLIFAIAFYIMKAEGMDDEPEYEEEGEDDWEETKGGDSGQGTEEGV